MAPTHDKTALITGANGGLGNDTARQLALRADFAKISLGCRNLARSGGEARAGEPDRRVPL